MSGTPRGQQHSGQRTDPPAGDEVVIWDQNHPTNNILGRAAERFGFTVKRVKSRRAREASDLRPLPRRPDAEDQ